MSKKMIKKKERYETTLRLTGANTYSLMEQLEAICKREGWTLNFGIRKAIEEYVMRHGLGNNSFQLDKYGVTWTKAQSVNKCGYAKCEGLAVGVGVFLPKHQTFGLCKFHFDEAKRNRKVWADLKCPTDSDKRAPKGSGGKDYVF